MTLKTLIWATWMDDTLFTEMGKAEKRNTFGEVGCECVLNGELKGKIQDMFKKYQRWDPYWHKAGYVKEAVGYMRLELKGVVRSVN